jgi:hypothetical protein
MLQRVVCHDRIPFVSNEGPAGEELAGGGGKDESAG